MDSDKQDLSIYERMIGILGALPAIGATQRNVQQNYNFRGYADVLNALNPLLAEWGVFYVPEVLECRVEERSKASGNGSMYVTRLHVSYTFFGAKGDGVRCSAWGEGSDAGDKGTSKAMTGAMKYALFQAFAISVDEVQDGDATSPEASRRVQTPEEALAARKAEWGTQPLPDGWDTYEVFDEAHQTFTAGMKALNADDTAKVKAFLKSEAIGWPMSKPQYETAVAFVEHMNDDPEQPV